MTHTAANSNPFRAFIAGANFCQLFLSCLQNRCRHTGLPYDTIQPSARRQVAPPAIGGDANNNSGSDRTLESVSGCHLWNGRHNPEKEVTALPE